VPKPTVPTDFEPIISANYGKKGAQFLLFFEFWLTIILLIYINKPFYDYIFDGHFWLIIIIPLAIYGLFWQYAGITLLLNAIIYKIFKKIEPPKEGVFPINGREFNYYCYRFWICYYTIYIMRAMPLPWADMFAFKMFGSKIGGNVVLYDSWIDIEFVDIGDSVMLSLNAALFSHCIYHDKFLVRRVVINKNAIVGAEAVVAPGTVLEDGAVLGAGCSTHIDQRLGAYLIHVGTPASLELPIKILDEDEEETPKKDSKKEEK
jgi:acetyltransferase-like isoleucine patch superfamily enzyme